MTSSAYNSMQQTILMLRKHLLPAKFSPTGDYKSRIYTGVVSFRVLSHAAVEEYIETRVEEIALLASRAALSGAITHCAACLVSFSEHSFGLPPSTIGPPQENQKKAWAEKVDIKERIKKSAVSYIKHVKTENHGIKEKNLVRLLLPIGANFDSIDPILISELNGFGERRGIFAHTSALAHIEKKPDPKDEYEKIKAILKLLLSADQEFDRVYSSIPKLSE